MKRTLTLIALVAICSATLVSCKNTKTTPEEIQQQKQALADSVLVDIDDLAEQLFDALSKSFKLKTKEFTDAEKMVKPDYLLDPSVASTLVTKSQKINALAIYVVEYAIRNLYDMPVDDVMEVIAKLAADVNHPTDLDYLMSDAPTSEKIKREYEICKERGDFAYFWQYQYALPAEISYILANNPDLFYNEITQEQWEAYSSRIRVIADAIGELSEYDEEMANVWEFRTKFRVFSSDEERDTFYQSVESAKQFLITNKDKYIAYRNALLQ